MITVGGEAIGYSDAAERDDFYKLVAQRSATLAGAVSVGEVRDPALSDRYGQYAPDSRNISVRPVGHQAVSAALGPWYSE